MTIKWMAAALRRQAKWKAPLNPLLRPFRVLLPPWKGAAEHIIGFWMAAAFIVIAFGATLRPESKRSCCQIPITSTRGPLQTQSQLPFNQEVEGGGRRPNWFATFAFNIITFALWLALWNELRNLIVTSWTANLTLFDLEVHWLLQSTFSTCFIKTVAYSS